jgi:Flp pilus assembly protein TadG
VAEFAMVIVMLLMIFLGLLSICLWAYSRNLLTSAAADAARYAANADVPDAAAAGRVRHQLAGTVAAGTLDTLRCTASAEGLMVEVSCTMDAPGVVGWLDGLFPTITVTGHAAAETTG